MADDDKKPMKVVLSKQVQIALASMDEETRKQVLDEIERIASGEVQGQKVTEEERQLLLEQGVDLNASFREALEQAKKGESES